MNFKKILTKIMVIALVCTFFASVGVAYAATLGGSYIGDVRNFTTYVQGTYSKMTANVTTTKLESTASFYNDSHKKSMIQVFGNNSKGIYCIETRITNGTTKTVTSPAAKVDGAVCERFHEGTLRYTNNPSSMVVDLLTTRVIKPK